MDYYNLFAHYKGELQQIVVKTNMEYDHQKYLIVYGNAGYNIEDDKIIKYFRINMNSVIDSKLAKNIEARKLKTHFYLTHESI